MDETGVLGLLEELSILLEDAKPVFGKSNLRQVDIAAAFDIMDEIADLFPAEFSQARQNVRARESWSARPAPAPRTMPMRCSAISSRASIRC